MTPTPTPKEGPPTLRECREVFEKWNTPTMTDDEFEAWQKGRLALLPRLTDEALERDEKRRAALEKLPGITKELMDNLLSALRELEKTGFDCKCDMSVNMPCHSHGYIEMARGALKDLDALAPKENHESKE